MSVQMLSLRNWMIALLVSMASFSVQAAMVSQDEPGKMVQELSDQLIAKVEEDRAKLLASPEAVIEFAREYVLPYVAQEKMARFVMGIHWRSATDKQRQEFIDAFTENLIRSYSSNFLKLEVQSAKVDAVTEPKPRKAEIASTITLKDGQSVQVVYRAFEDKTTKKWLLYDFTFNNISTLVSFRNVYGAMIDRDGITKVIAELQKSEDLPEGAKPDFSK